MIISIVCFSSVEQVVREDFFFFFLLPENLCHFLLLLVNHVHPGYKPIVDLWYIRVYILLVVFCQANNFFSNIVNYILKKEHYNACVLIPTASV